MKKKLLSILFAATLSFTLTACGGGSGNDSSSASENTGSAVEETPEAEPLNLTGTWASEDNDGSYQEAVITEDTIEINWVSDGGETKSLYWAGSYEAPEDSTDTYTWTSDRDKEKTDTALMASTDDTKEFTYEDGEITYSVSALGTTTTMHLEKQK